MNKLITVFICGTSRVQFALQIVPLAPKVKIQTTKLSAVGFLFSHTS